MGVTSTTPHTVRVTMASPESNLAFVLKASRLWVKSLVLLKLHDPQQMGSTCVSSLVSLALHELQLLGVNPQLGCVRFGLLVLHQPETGRG